MSRACSVCTHPKRRAIDTELVSEQSIRGIAKQFGIGDSALQRHKNNHLAQIITTDRPHLSRGNKSKPAPKETEAFAESYNGAERQTTIDVMAGLTKQVERVTRLSDAVDRWLQDPDDPTQYDINPRSDDVSVVYFDYTDLTPNGQPKRKKEKLSTLLAKIDDSHRAVVQSAEIRIADPRELLIKAADGLKGQMQLLVGILDRLYSAQQIEAFEGVVLEAIGEVAPDVRRAIEDNLRRRQPVRGFLGSPFGR